MYMTVEFKLTHSLSADEIKERGNDYINESDDKYADKDDSSRLAFIQWRHIVFGADFSWLSHIH